MTMGDHRIVPQTFRVKRNRGISWDAAFPGHKTGLQIILAWTLGGRYRTGSACVSIIGACCPVSFTQSETRHNIAAAFDPPETLASSPRQTPRTDFADHARSCVQSYSSDFSVY